MATTTRNDASGRDRELSQLPESLEEDRLPKKARVDQVSNLDSSSFPASSSRKRTASSRSSPAVALQKTSSPPSPTSDDSRTSTPTGKFKKSKRQRSSPHSHSEGLEYDDEDDVAEEEPPRLTPPAQSKHEASGFEEISAEESRKYDRELKKTKNSTPPVIEKSTSNEGQTLHTRQASTQSITSFEESEECSDPQQGPELEGQQPSENGPSQKGLESSITTTTPEEGKVGDEERTSLSSSSSFGVDSTRKFEELSEYMKETQVLAGLVVEKVNKLYKQAAEALMTTVSQSVPITQRIQEQLLRSRAEVPPSLVEEKESKTSAADPETRLRRSQRKVAQRSTQASHTKSPRSESSSSPPSATAARQARSLSNSSKQSSEHRTSPPVSWKPPAVSQASKPAPQQSSGIAVAGRETPALATRPSVASFHQVGLPLSAQHYAGQHLHPGSQGFLLPVPPQPQPLEYMFSPERGIWMPSDPRLTHQSLRRMSQLPYLPADYQQGAPFPPPRGPAPRGPPQFPGWMPPYPRGDPRLR